MIKRFYILDGVKYARVNRTKARNLFISGYPVLFCPCNLRPGRPWYPEIEFTLTQLDTSFEERKNNFNKTLYNFMYYNCNWESGLYVSFYASLEILENL